MLEKLLSLIPNKKTRDVATMATGMLGLLSGQKVLSLGLFGRGAMALEKEWRERHPEVEGFDERWRRAIEFYDATHKDPVNRKLHIIGIPMIVGGTAGLLLFSPFRPMWLGAAGLFVAGWALNFVGHGLFEKNAPAFADDPLSFIAGPVWDFQQLFRKGKNGAPEGKNGARPHLSLIHI